MAYASDCPYQDWGETGSFMRGLDKELRPRGMYDTTAEVASAARSFSSSM